MTFGFGFCSVLGKTWVLVRFFLAGFGFLSHIYFFFLQDDANSEAAQSILAGLSRRARRDIVFVLQLVLGRRRLAKSNQSSKAFGRGLRVCVGCEIGL